MDVKNKIKGAFIGLYFGAGVNPRFSPMLEPKEALRRFGDKKFAQYYDFEIYGSRYKLYDQYTQTKLIYGILIKYGKITPEIFKDYLLVLHKKYNVFKGDVYGPSTQKAITKIIAGENVYEMGKTGITCGSAMRGLPIGMYFYNNEKLLIENTINSCIISHNTDVAIDAAIASNVTLASLINGKNKFDAIKEAIKAIRKYHGKFGAKTTEPRIDEILEGLLRNLRGKNLEEAREYIVKRIGVSWFARDVVPSAFANYIVLNSPEESSLLSMRCGGDNQTTSEIACAFHGAEKGVGIFSKDILKNIEKVNKIKIYGMADKLIRKIFKAS